MRAIALCFMFLFAKEFHYLDIGTIPIVVWMFSIRKILNKKLIELNIKTIRLSQAEVYSLHKNIKNIFLIHLIQYFVVSSYFSN